MPAVVAEADTERKVGGGEARKPLGVPDGESGRESGESGGEEGDSSGRLESESSSAEEAMVG